MITSTTAKTRTTSGAGKYTGTWGDAQLRHLLKRTLFGANEDDMNHFSGKTMDQVVDELLNVSSTAPSPPVNAYNNQRATDPDIPLGQTWVNGPRNPLFFNQRMNSMKSWWMGLCVNQDRNIREKLTLFWHNHFATETQVVREPIVWYNHLKLLRSSCLGNFKQFVRDITIDPAMLIYLNGQLNTKAAPDENYARELQELFTLGKGEGSGYTEHDVQEAARVLTGYRVNRTTGEYFFQPNRHDETDKTFSAYFGNATITGRSGRDGENELDDLLDMIFSKEEVSKFICRRLYMWFVYYDIDSQVESDVIEPLAAVFRSNNYEIKPVIKALLTSEHFYDAANMGAIIKSPADFMVGLSRQMKLTFPDSSKLVQQYYFWQLMVNICAQHQQSFGDPPSVAGWPAYYQLPLFYEAWVNSSTLPQRNQISDLLAFYGVTYQGEQLIIDSIAVADQFSKPEDPGALIDELLRSSYTLPVSSDQKDYMKSILLGGQIDDSYWTNAWNDHKNDPTNAAKKTLIELRLKTLLKYVMNLSEFQLF
jgi:uncharacterized protein (DUF1800 family)